VTGVTVGGRDLSLGEDSFGRGPVLSNMPMI